MVSYTAELILFIGAKAFTLGLCEVMSCLKNQRHCKHSGSKRQDLTWSVVGSGYLWKIPLSSPHSGKWSCSNHIIEQASFWSSGASSIGNNMLLAYISQSRKLLKAFTISLQESFRLDSILALQGTLGSSQLMILICSFKKSRNTNIIAGMSNTMLQAVNVPVPVRNTCLNLKCAVYFEVSWNPAWLEWKCWSCAHRLSWTFPVATSAASLMMYLGLPSSVSPRSCAV